MIPGAATASGTRAYAQEHKQLQFNCLGRTRWRVSQAGFGCYRVSAGIDAHFEAMKLAVTNGINVIDTSTNYTDGGSEQLVGKVLGQAISENRISRDQLVVVSKVGYLHGLLWPHIQGVFDFLKPHAANLESLEHWLRSHKKKLEAAITAVGSLYVNNAVREITAIKQKVRACDVDWNMDGPLSQLAIRVLRTTSGIHAVLVGMRQARYVNDVLEELARPVEAAERTDAWHHLHAALAAL